MSGIEQIQDLSWALYILIFASVAWRAMRRPTPSHIDMALFFGAAATLILFSVLPNALGLDSPVWASDISGALLMSLAYLLLRLVRDFTDVPAWIMRASEVGLIASIVAIVLLAPQSMPPWVVFGLVGYFLAVIVYDSWMFVRAAIQTRGVTRRRMQAVALGSGCVGLVLLFAGMSAAFPNLGWLWSELNALLGLASAVCYFLGFAPPTWLRRAWQEPELRSFLNRAAQLPRLPDTPAILHELAQGAAEALGAPSASIGLWDGDRQRLVYSYEAPPGSERVQLAEPGTVTLQSDEWLLDPTEHPIAGSAFLEQRPLLVMDVFETDPKHADLYRIYNTRSALVAPITAGEHRLGVLAVNAPRAPFFANSDLELTQLLADHAAVILESRALIDEAARVRAREEATRLKDDFLSSAAHDLKTPLTGLVTQAQLLRRRSERDPTAPVDRVGLDRLVDQSLRLRDLVLELLDVSRLEHGSLVGERSPVDLALLARELVARERADWGRVRFEADQPVIVKADAARFEQVIVNLVENALKYSPDGGEVLLKVWTEASEARLCVRDEGIGITAEDVPLIFERFHRGKNVDDRRFVGMGLGLYITRGIVEQHAGRIWVDSTPGTGSTFVVALPLAVVSESASGPEPGQAPSV